MRLLALSVGNTSLFGSVFTDKKPSRIFRVVQRNTKAAGRAKSNVSVVPGARGDVQSRRKARDFFSCFRRVRGPIDRVVLCSVVPALTAEIRQAIERKFSVSPLILNAGSNHGLRIAYKKPRTLGADRVAAALGARAFFPRQHVIVVDCGTATTVTALHRDGRVLGGAILPGLGLWSEMLATRTAQLPVIALRRPSTALGRSTSAAIAAGIFHGHAGAVRELIARVHNAAFGRAAAVIVGTGGHAPLFATESLFDVIEPALVLHGLRVFAEQASAV